MPKAVVNGIELYYEETGKGEVMIFLHGLTSNHLMLKQEMDYFKDRFRVIGLDSRGHGKSEKPLTYTLNDHVQDVIAFMDDFGIERANLFGMSMGTYVAQGVAVAIPDRVNKLILVSGNSHAKDPSTSLLGRHANELNGLTFEEQMAKLSSYIFHDLVSVGKWLEGIPGGLTREQQEIAANALVEFDFRPDLHKVTAKTLVINGRHDGLNPPEDGKEIAIHIPNAQFVVFENSGHAPNIEDRVAFLELVDSFLNE
ncbi:alpha/beta fold hydrolase [Ornithinibacillus bavariensis]|uniref:alpha/beta fold hydrolase n=1 Tax=Ornithinibacillus bavariensis TaxID=545502 RepID=UPI000EC4E89A|nr:esterase [Ornithinibacillus sp.]